MPHAVRVVLDASVLIAAFLSETGASRALVRHAQAQAFTLILSATILAEVEHNLLRLGVTKRTTNRYGRALRRISALVNPASVPRVIREHPPDDAILACAVVGKADVLVTLDRRHLLPLRTHRGVPITLPGDFLRTLPMLPDR